ncbi:uncharacterized protein N7479_009410 [Penicillium vulpinum]|uniref:uncharacterized protein n=1 Tax=Penicillium vulpinum TaxID=29845 RepID=UPI00254918FE|nr:uncharacterized protein N7479_009410 [Penicillium vulpinum]KAJ5950997.1 hypothetical protein N7479_009410 [Penicillium vulpinum]
MDSSPIQSSPSAQLAAMILNSPSSATVDTTDLNSSPSALLVAMALNSSPTQNGSPDVLAELSPSQSSLSVDTSPRTPRLVESYSPTASPPNTPSPLERHRSSNLNRVPLQLCGDGGTLSHHPSEEIQHLPREPSLPYEAWEAIFYATLSSTSMEEYDFFYGDVFENPETKKTLSTLRLVNRTWNRVASPLMFRCLQAVLGYSVGRPLEIILRISESHHAMSVRDVRFGFVGAWLPGLGYDRYINDLAAGALPVLISRFQNIQTLRIQTPPVVDTFSEDGQIKPQMLAKFTNALVHSLRFMPVSRLRCLHISMPTTAEFARFFELNSYARDFVDVFAQIQELHITINDSTGPDGRRDPKWPRSIVKTKYPVDRFSPYLIQLIAYAKNLQVLNLEARTWFDVSDLEAEGLAKLKSLRLEGVRIKDTTLKNIFLKARETLLRIELVHVRLMTGTWEDAFRFPPWNMIWLRVDGCGYSTTGSSAHHIGYSFMNYPTALWTLHGRDWLALTHWRAVVNANRRRNGLPNCPHCFFPGVNPNTNPP